MTAHRPIRVLVADDVPAVREGLAALLAAYGIDVVAEAGDGRDAVRLAVSLRPDVAIVDCRMPGLDGVTAALHISTLAPEVGVLIHTAHTDRQLAEEAHAAGARGFLWKGIDAAELVAAVQGAAHRVDASLDGDPWFERLVR